MKILYSKLITMAKLGPKQTMFVAILAWLLIPSLGHATDTKVYPGASCQPFTGSTAPDLTSGINAIINGSPNLYRLVTCPIVADNESITPGQQIFIQVNVQSSNSQQLLCAAYNLSSFGNILSSVDESVFSNFPTTLFMSLPVS